MAETKVQSTSKLGLFLTHKERALIFFHKSDSETEKWFKHLSKFMVRTDFNDAYSIKSFFFTSSCLSVLPFLPFLNPGSMWVKLKVFNLNKKDSQKVMMGVSIDKKLLGKGNCLYFFHAIHKIKHRAILEVSEIFEATQSVILVFEPDEKLIVLKKILEIEDFCLHPMVALEILKEVASRLEELKRHQIFITNLSEENILISKTREPISIRFGFFEAQLKVCSDNTQIIHKLAKML